MKKTYKDAVKKTYANIATIIDKTNKMSKRFDETNTTKDEEYHNVLINLKVINALLSLENENPSEIIDRCNEILSLIHHLSKYSYDIAHDEAIQKALKNTAFVLAYATQQLYKATNNNNFENKYAIQLPDFLKEKHKDFYRIINETEDGSAQQRQLAEFIYKITSKALAKECMECRGETEESYSTFRPR